MKFGHFNDTKKEYVITTPKTPLPWINYLGTEKMFGIVSNTAGGYTFYQDAKLRRITRYRYNDVPADSTGRYFFIKDENEFWSPTWQPVKTKLDEYKCRHGLGYTIIESEKNKIASEITFFIPNNENVEIKSVKISNNDNRPRNIKLFSYVEFCLWNADDDDRNFQRNLNCGEVEIDDSTIYHKTEYRERRNHYAYCSVNHKVNSFDSDRESFLGPYGELRNPAAVEKGECTNSIAAGWSPISANCINLELDAGETKELIYILGYVENPEDEKFESKGVINKSEARRQIAAFQNSEQIDAALKDLENYWNKILKIYTVGCDDKKLSRMLNVWHPYQCMVTFNMSRSASYFESGVGRGMGFRDSNQDLLGFVHLEPEKSRQRILDIAATQLESGGAYHQYQPLTKRGNSDIGGNFNDDPQWLIIAVCAYLKETGDFDILKENVPYDNNDDLAQPLFDHLFRAHKFTLERLGPHKLPLIGRADWNDCLNLNCFSTEPGESFQTTGDGLGKIAESLMIAGLFVYAAKELNELLKFLKITDKADEIQNAIDEMTENVNLHGRDENWFLRAYDARGKKVGSEENDEGKIYIESQGWCIMAGMGVDDGFAKKSLDSVDKFLNTKHGLVLQHPPYSEYDLYLGEVSSYPPGYKENGGIFCHTNPWIMIAETLVKNPKRAFEYYKKICPAYREEISDIHRCEPYVYAQMIAGKAAGKHGEAKNSWLTGTAAWNYVAVSQYILGIRPGYYGLIIDPVIDANLGEINIVRFFRGTKFNIKIEPSTAETTERTILVDGKKIIGKEIPTTHKEISVIVK